MATKRMRVFAGPNGSGKTTIINRVKGEIAFGVYVNADDIEQQLRAGSVLLFDTYQLTFSQDNVQQFFRDSKFSPIKTAEPDLWKRLTVRDNILYVHGIVNSYLAADLAELIRVNLLNLGISFTYETVMSHESKISFFQRAKENGYRVYLYYVATEDPEINVSRVEVRVAQKGHAVRPQTIKDRYYRSLEHLKNAIKQTNRAYIFDNSGSASVLVAEITEGEDVHVIDPEQVPNWFVKYVAG